MPKNHSNTNRVITILIHSDKTRFRNVLGTLLRRVTKDVFSSLLACHKCYDCRIFSTSKQIKNARYKRNALEFVIVLIMFSQNQAFTMDFNAFCWWFLFVLWPTVVTLIYIWSSIYPHMISNRTFCSGICIIPRHWCKVYS